MIKKYCAALLVALMATAAHSQEPPSTVGDLLQAGGKQLSAEEVTSLLSGARVRGTQVGRTITFDNVMSADGTLKGTSVGAGGPASQTAQWKVLADGAVISDYKGSNGATWQAKSVWYQLG